MGKQIPMAGAICMRRLGRESSYRPITHGGGRTTFNELMSEKSPTKPDARRRRHRRRAISSPGLKVARNSER